MSWPRGRCPEPARKHPDAAAVPPNPAGPTSSSTAWSRGTATLFRPTHGQQRHSVDVTKSRSLRLTYTTVGRLSIRKADRTSVSPLPTGLSRAHTCWTCWGLAASLPTSSGPSHVFNTLLAAGQHLLCRERESGVPELRGRSGGCRSTLSIATRETHCRSGQP